MIRIKNEIHIGISMPFTLLHASDTHLTLADSRDNERKNLLAQKRAGVFPNASQNLEEIKNEIRSSGALLAYSGDLIDFVSSANLDAARAFCSEFDCFFAAGNHEFSQYVGEAFEDEAYRNQSLARVQAAFSNDIRFSSRMVNGVNLVAVDNSYYLVDECQLNALKAECEKGFPIILVMHTPLYEENLCRDFLAHSRQPFAYAMCAPESLLSAYSESRRIQQTPDRCTLEAFDLIIRSPQIRAILTGHLHYDYESRLNDRLTQYVTGVDTLREIRID